MSGLAPSTGGKLISPETLQHSKCPGERHLAEESLLDRKPCNTETMFADHTGQQETFQTLLGRQAQR